MKTIEKTAAAKMAAIPVNTGMTGEDLTGKAAVPAAGLTGIAAILAAAFPTSNQQ